MLDLQQNHWASIPAQKRKTRIPDHSTVSMNRFPPGFFFNPPDLLEKIRDTWVYSAILPGSLTARPWKMTVWRWISFWLSACFFQGRAVEHPGVYHFTSHKIHVVAWYIYRSMKGWFYGKLVGINPSKNPQGIRSLWPNSGGLGCWSPSSFAVVSQGYSGWRSVASKMCPSKRSQDVFVLWIFFGDRTFILICVWRGDQNVVYNWPMTSRVFVPPLWEIMGGSSAGDFLSQCVNRQESARILSHPAVWMIDSTGIDTSQMGPWCANGTIYVYTVYTYICIFFGYMFIIYLLIVHKKSTIDIECRWIYQSHLKNGLIISTWVPMVNIPVTWILWVWQVRPFLLFTTVKSSTLRRLFFVAPLSGRGVWDLKSFFGRKLPAF